MSSPFAEVLHNLGLAEALGHDKIQNISNLYAEATELPQNSGNTLLLLYAWSTKGLCYRSDLVDAPTFWMGLLKPHR